jgi:nitrite reductase/ring-hydroxylating ferredoxin subunit
MLAAHLILEDAPLEPTEFTPVRVLPDARRLREGDGVRFSVVLDGVPRDAFAVRYHGRVRAYVNSCRHQSLALDFGDAHFFDEGYDALVCCHHGARYRPESGECFEGPCRGARLTPLVVEERGAGLWCLGAGG